MSGQQLISPSGDGVNPYAPPVTQEDPWTIGDPAAVAMRRENQKDEAFLKAMGILNYFYALFFGYSFAFNVSYPILYALRRMDAPWSIQPHWILPLVLNLLLTILAAVAGYGFRRLKPWAFRVEAILAICWLILWFTTSFYHHRTAPMWIAEVFVVLFLFLAFAAPMMNLLDLRHSVVVEPTYQTVIEATSHVRVRAKFPLEPKLVSGFLLVCAALAFYFSSMGS
jgi:hypothetical protein